MFETSLQHNDTVVGYISLGYKYLQYLSFKLSDINKEK